MENRVQIAKRILTAQEVSDRLRISLSTVHHLTRLGKIKAVKIGKQWRYTSDDVEQYLNGGFDLRGYPMERRRADRRGSPRMNCFIQGRAVISVFPVKNWEGDGAVLNLSEGGLFFEANEALEEEGEIHCDDPVIVALYFPSSLRPELELNGRIVHLHSTEDQKTRFGMKFRNLTPETQRAIHDYIG